MKKSIFLFFAAILCAMTANAQWALMGTLTDWSSGKAMTVSGTTATCDVDLTANTTYTLKVKNGSTWYGRNSTTITATTTTSVFSTSGGDVTLKSTFNGTYTFSFDTSTKKLTVTYPTEDKPIETHDITVKAKYPAGWNAGKAAIHFWGNGVTGTTPAAMTKDGDWWTYTVTGVPTTSPLSVIFINGDNWNGDKNQTVDITGITENTCFQVSQSGSAKGTAVKADCETGEGEVIETHDITVKAFYPAGWNAGKAAIHFWGDGVASPGTPAAMTKDGDWWSYTVTGVPTTTELSVIFINGNTWSGDANQTVDITGIKESTCYQITSGSGKASAAVVDCASTPVVAEDVYTVVGSDNLFGSAWSPAAEANDMEKQDDGSYKKVYSNVELTSDVIWKIAKNDNWWDGPTFNANNNTLSIAKSGIYNVTFTLSADLKTANATAELLEETNTVADCYISGNAALTGGAGWAGNEFKMEYNEATATYSYTFTALAAETEYLLKVVLGDWYGYEKLQTVPAGVENKEGNIAFTLAEVGDVTVTYNKDNGINITGNFAIPVTYDYYIAGNMNGWDKASADYGMTDENADGIYEKEITLAAGQDHQFKVTNGKWGSETDGFDCATVEGTYEEVDSNDGNVLVKLNTETTFTVIFNAATGKITFEGLTVIEDYYTVVGVAELFGTAWDRANETNKMAKQGDGSYKLIKENVTLAAIGYDWKIAKNGDWWNDAATGVNPSEGNNTLTITTAGRYNVTFTLAADLKSATVEPELLEAAVVIPDCFISGNATLTGGAGWEGNEFTMVYDEATETWSYTLAGLQPEKEYALKVVCGGTWKSYADLTSVPAGVTQGNDDAIAFKMAEAGDVTVTYNVEAGITLSGNFYVAPTYDYYIAGTLAGGWSATQQGMIKDGDLYKAIFSELPANTYQFKITDGQWNTEEDKTHEFTTLGVQYEEVSYADGNIQIVTEEAINLTVIFDAAAGEITFEGLTEIVPTELVYKVTVPAGTPNCYIVFGDAWDAENAPAMIKIDDTHYTYTRTGLKSDEYKYLYGQSWDFVEVRTDNRTWAEEDVVGEWNNPYTEVRTGLTAGNYYTICMTKEMKEVKGATLWSFRGKDANFAYLVQEDAPYAAGKAYIMYAEAETVSAILTGEPALDPVANGAIHGTFVPMEQTDLDNAGDNIYLVIGNQLRCVDGQTGNSLPANRAYVDIDEITGGAPAGIPANRVRSMPMQPQVATGMENVDASAQPVKTIINGQLFILRGEKMYDAQGKLVK